MGEHAFLSVASQPISATGSVKYYSDQRQQLLAKTDGLQQNIYESVEAYQERMKKFNEERLKRLEAENTTTAEKKYNDILSKYLTQTTDVSTMEKGLSELKSLFRFTYNNKVNDTSFDDNLYLAKKQENVISNRLYKLKNGQEDDSAKTSNPMLYSGEFQQEGQRDFLG